MNNQIERKRHRGRTLLVVEGRHEQDILIPSIRRAFPEIWGENPDILVFHTNIYLLYELLIKEYGNDIDKGIYVDIDLPFVVSNTEEDMENIYKRDFVNIILIFDYERHDPNFTERKIACLQRLFSDTADNGQLYINYPMVEAYQNFCSFFDDEFLVKKFRIIKKGSEYKSSLRYSFVKYAVELPNRMFDIIKERFPHMRVEDVGDIIKHVLELSYEDLDAERIDLLFAQSRSKKTFEMSNLFCAMLKRIKYWNNGNYNQYIREVFIMINNAMCGKERMMLHTNGYNDSYINGAISDSFKDILEIQNKESKIEGVVWVLNTSVLLVMDYNSDLMKL